MRRRGKFGNPDQLAFAWPLAPPSPGIDLVWASRVLGSEVVANDVAPEPGHYTYRAIAAELGVSISTAHKTERSMVAKLRRGFRKLGLSWDEGLAALQGLS